MGLKNVAKWLVKYQNAGNLSALAGAYLLYELQTFVTLLLGFSILLICFAVFCTIFEGFEDKKESEKLSPRKSFSEIFKEWRRKRFGWKGIKYDLIVFSIATIIATIILAATDTFLTPYHTSFALFMASMSIADMVLSNLGLRP